MPDLQENLSNPSLSCLEIDRPLFSFTAGHFLPAAAIDKGFILYQYDDIIRN
jgi:hypothetical protein